MSSSWMRDHSRSSITSGLSAARRRKAIRSVHRQCPSTWASRLSSLAPATVKRSRKRSSCLGLMENPAKPRSSSVSTTGPRGVSIATAISAGGAPVVSSSQAHNSDRAAPPCVTSRSHTRLPSASSRQTQCCSRAQSTPTNQRNWSLIPASCLMRATATILDPCTGARGANLLLEIRRGRSAGAHVLRWCSRHGWAWVAPGSSARLASLKPRPAREPQKGTGWAALPPTRGQSREGRSCPPLRAAGNATWNRPDVPRLTGDRLYFYC